MVRKFILGIMFFLLVFPLASAFDTQIKVKTLVGHRVSIFVYPTGSLASINSYYLDTDGEGKVSVVHTSSDKELDVLVKVTNNGENVFKEKFEGYEAGEPISIKMDYEEITGEYDEAVQKNVTSATTSGSTASETVANSTPEVKEAVEENTSASEPLTGKVVDSGGSGFSKIFYFIIGGVLIVGAVVFIVARYTRFNVPFVNKSVSGDGAPTYFRSNNMTGAKGSGFNMSHSSSAGMTTPAVGSDINELENKIKEAERQLNLLKNREKIRIAEKRLEEDRKELDKLRRGE